MYEIDFLAIEETGELGSKSGDALTMRFTEAATGRNRIVVIDGGYSYTGEAVVEHLNKWYGSRHIDLMVSTHPDQDHINGLTTIMEASSIGELMIHRPHDHAGDVSDFSNIEVVDALIGLAEDEGIPVTEPFTGVTRFGGQVRILGPTVAYYEELVGQHLKEVTTGEAAARVGASGAPGGLLAKAVNIFDRVLSYLPVETLGEDGDSGPRNNSSVITLLTVDDERMLFTGDAGIPALSAAWGEYESLIATPDSRLHFFQAPHHGSKRNLAPSLLNRMFGQPGDNVRVLPAFISSAKQDPKHPSPKVTNALSRRSVTPYATESNNLVHKSRGVPMRPGYGPATAIGPLDEDDV